MKKKVVYIEDNETNQFVIDHMLKDHYEVECYLYGEEYFAEAGRESPALFILDIHLGADHMDGIEVLKFLRKDANLIDVPIIALTAYAYDWTQKERYLNEGFEVCHTKPVTKEELLATLNRLIV